MMFKNGRQPVIVFLFLINIIFGQIKGKERVENVQTLRVLDINVWSGLNYKGIFKMGEYETDSIREARYQALIHQIRELDPDVVGIHEANKLPYYIERLVRDLGYEGFAHVGLGGIRMGPVGIPWNLCEGDGFLIKKHLHPQWAGRKQLSGGYVGNWFTFHLSDATQIIAIKIECNKRPLTIFATHWHASVSDSTFSIEKLDDLYHEHQITKNEHDHTLSKIKRDLKKRFSESLKTIEFIKKTAGQDPFILMGDMNAEPGSREIINLLDHGMIDLFHLLHPDSPGFTWNPETNTNHHTYYRREDFHSRKSDVYEKLELLSGQMKKRIDYIFLSPESTLNSGLISVQSCRVVLDDVVNGVHASDHYGVFAEIRIKD